MATITYTGASETIEWFGQSFTAGEPVETDNEALIRAAGRNPLFKVSDSASADADTPFNRGAQAAREGKKRSVPPAYRGKSEAEQWLAGFDSETSGD